MGDAAGDGLVIIKVEREFQLFDGDFLDVSSEAGFEVDVIEVAWTCGIVRRKKSLVEVS